jgi:membrane protease YdiL (CAAX protease family)
VRPPPAAEKADPVPAAGWYADPSGRSAWRWWDGEAWTDWVHPPVGSPMPAPAFVEPATSLASRPLADPPAEPVPLSRRRRLLAELALVLAVFPLPYTVSAVVDLVSAALGDGEGQRTPVLIRGHAGASFPLELVLILLPFAAAGLVAYLLSAPSSPGSPPSGEPGEPGEGGLRALGLDLRNWRGDIALVLVVFLLCNLLPVYGGEILLHALGIHGLTPSTNGGPGYYLALDIVNGITSGIVEEIVVLGYLVRRLEQLRLPGWAVVALAVVVRGSYHLYYGWDVLPILLWAWVTVMLYRRYRRLLPFIVVHVIWDTSLFVESALTLRGGGIFLGLEAVVLIPVSLVCFRVWRNRIPAVRSARS